MRENKKKKKLFQIFIKKFGKRFFYLISDPSEFVKNELFVAFSCRRIIKTKMQSILDSSLEQRAVFIRTTTYSDNKVLFRGKKTIKFNEK